AGDTTGAPARNGDPAAISGHGGVGVPGNFLEVHVNAVASDFGYLTITDQASQRSGWNIDSPLAQDLGSQTGTYGVFVTETDDHMQINTIYTNGDASLAAQSGDLRDGRGATHDGLNGSTDAPNVEANNIDLAAYCRGANSPMTCGNIGARAPPGSEDQLGNDLKIDSGHGDTQHPSQVIVGRVGIETQNDAYVTETDGALDVLIAQSQTGNIRLSVREHSTVGDDLNLILPYASDTLAPAQNRDAILFDYSGVYNVERTIGTGAGVTNTASINAAGWILLRAGDNVTLGGLRLSPDFTGDVSFTRDTVNGDTISSTSPAWAAAAFAVGQWITVSGAGANNGTYQIAALVDQNTVRLYQKGAVTTATGVRNVTVTTQTYPDALLHPGAGSLTDAQRISQNTKVVAGSWIDIHGDYDIYSGGGQGDTGTGTVVHVHGTVTPGPLSTACSTKYEPGRDCGVTRIFGNTDSDTITFDQSFLGGKTRAYGSKSPTCASTTTYTDCVNVWAPFSPSDGEDFFVVNQLQTMFPAGLNSQSSASGTLLGYVPPSSTGDVLAGHTLTLDGQDATDTYVIDTTGSQPCFQGTDDSGSTCHNYVINVLDTGKPDHGNDVLIVNGVDGPTAGNGSDCNGYSDFNNTVSCPTDDIFLLRGMNYIGSTPTSGASSEVADDPAFVALLHGNFGTQTLAFTGNLTLCYNASGNCEPGQRLTAAAGTFHTATASDPVNSEFVVGRRIHLGGTGAGVWAGDYTIASVDTVNGAYIVLEETLPTGISLTTEQVPTADVQLQNVTIGVLLGDVTTPDPNGDASLRNQNYERINYDTGINGRLIVNGLGGNDAFFSDDNSAVTTLDGGLGNDSFQIGQIYGLSRDSLNTPANCTPRLNGPNPADPLTYDTSCGSLNPEDVFGTVATTRGWLSRGVSQPLVAVGDAGDDTFTVYSNQAALRLEGGDGNDLFTVRGFALAQTKLNGGDPTAPDCDPSPSTPLCDIVWINAHDQIAMPKLTSGFSTAAESDIRTGAGTNQVEYNMNAPVSVDGGAGFNKLVILGTEYADHIVVTYNHIYGVGVSVTYVNIQVLEIDALEGDDTIDVLSTAPGVATRVIGGLGNDTIDVAGDVTGDVFSLDIDGTSGTLNHGVSSLDPNYNGLVAPGIQYSVARAGQGTVVITQSDGSTEVFEGGCYAFGIQAATCGSPVGGTQVPALDSYTVHLANRPDCGSGISDPNCWVYVTVTAAYPPDSEHPENSGPYPDGPPDASGCAASNTGARCDGDTILLASSTSPAVPTSASGCGNANGSDCPFYRQVTLNGQTFWVSNRSIVLAFNGSNYNQDQTVFVWAVDDGRAEGTRIVTVSHSVIQPVCNASDLQNCFDGAAAGNVEVTVYDNDTADVLVTAVDPVTLHPDNNSVVLEGWGQTTALHPTTEQVDRYSITLSSAPVGTVVVDLSLSDLLPDPARLCLTSTDSRFDGSMYPATVPGDPTTCPSAFDPTKPYKVTFTELDWFKPVFVTLHGRNDFAPEDPHNTTITHTIDTSTSDAKYLAVVPGGSFAGAATLTNNGTGGTGDTISTTSFDWIGAGFAVGQAITVGGVGKDGGVYHIAAIVNAGHTLRLVEKGVFVQNLTSSAVYVSTANSVDARLDAMVLDDENPGVWVLESDGKTVVTACGTSCGVPGSNDTYQLRLDSQPTSQVRIALITDGQVDLQNDGNTLDSRLKLEQVGGLQAAQGFKGQLSVTAVASGTSVISRVGGNADLGNFISEGFQKNMRIRISGLGASYDGDFVVTDIAADGSTMTVQVAPPLPGGTPGHLPTSALGLSSGDVFIAILEDKGVYQGDIAYDPNGVGQALYTGGLSSTGTTTLTRATGSFISDQFMVGTRIQITDHTGAIITGGPFTIMAVSDKTLTLNVAMPSFSDNTATISKITGTLIRTDGTSWLDSGFLEGQLIRVTQPDGVTDLACNQHTTYNNAGSVTCLYKIEMITGTDAQKTNKISLTSTSSVGPFAGSAYRPDELGAAGDQQLAVVQWAWNAYFTPPAPGNAPQTCPVATCGDWYSPITVPLIADPFFELAPGRQNLTMFPKQPHLLSGIRGPLAVEGGTTAADRSLKGAVLLPGEDNLPAFRVAAQPPEWQSIDTLNVYADGSKEDTKGNLTSTALTGLNMGPGLDFTKLCGGQCPFSEPGKYPGGISYGSISLDPITHNFTTDGTLSTLEIVNILLGAGNDTLTIQSTLQQGGDFNPITGLRGELAHHGGITAVSGGGNALLRVDGTFELTSASGPAGTTAQLVRQDGLSWQRYGFQVGQEITLANGASYTITGFGNNAYGLGATMFLGGGQLPAPPTFSGSLTFTDNGVGGTGDTITASSFTWTGFAVNQAITITGAGANNGVYHIAKIVGTTLTLAEKGVLNTGVLGSATTAASVLGDLSGAMSVTDSLSVTSTFTLSSIGTNLNGVLLPNGQSWAGLGFGPMLGSFQTGIQPIVFIPGVGLRNVVGWNNGTGMNADGLPLDGAVLLVDGDPLSGTLTGTISLTNRYRVTGALTLTGSATGGTLVLPSGAVANYGLAVGQQLQISGVSGTRTITAINGDTLTLSDGPIEPFATGNFVTTSTTITRAMGDWLVDGFAIGQHVLITGDVTTSGTVQSVTSATLTLTGATISGTHLNVAVTTTTAASGTASLVRVGGDTISLTGPSFAGTLTTTAPSSGFQTISRATTATSDWIKDGFAAGQQIVLGGAGLTGICNVTGVTASTLTVSGCALPTAANPYTNSTATVLPVGAGPGQPYDTFAPLVIYGDTSQDGVWYGGDPHTQSLHNFGPKPMPHVDGLPITITRDNINGYTGTVSMQAGPSVTGTFEIGPVAYSTGTFTTTATTITRGTGSWSSDGFAVGQMIGVTGAANGTFQVTGIDGTGTILSVTPIAGALASGVLTVQSLSAFKIKQAGTWSATDFANGSTIDVTGVAGGTFTVVSGGGTSTLVVAPVGLSTLPVKSSAGLTVSKLNTGTNSSGSFLTDGFAVGQELALGPPTTVASSCATGCLIYDIWESHLTLHGNAVNDWYALGFRIGQQISIDPYSPSTWTVKGFAAGNTELELNGPQLDPLPNVSFKVSAVSQYIGIVKAVTKTSITLNLALSVADFPSGPLFPVGIGGSATTTAKPLQVLNRVGNSAPFFVFPLANPYLHSGNDVIDAHLLDLVDETQLGPATTISGTYTTTATTITQATGDFVGQGFAIGQTLTLSGSATGTFTITYVTALTLTVTPVGGSTLAPLATVSLTLTLHLLRPIGITAYGGPGDDTIVGSQTGDQLAGGSGNDTILGQRGEDIIYGDSGFNVSLITRLLTVAVDGTGPAGYNPAHFPDLDHLVAGNDLLYGEGPGSAPSQTMNSLGNDDDIIFGDLGVVTQDVSGARDVTKGIPSKPQALQTTIFSDQYSILRDRFGAVPSNAKPQLVTTGVLHIDSAAFQNHGDDWIYGNTDRDILVGGAGNDSVDGGIENDLVFGDNVSLGRTYHLTTSPRFQTLVNYLLYSRSDLTQGAFADNSGQLLSSGVDMAFRTVNDVPWWAEFDVLNMWQDFEADPTQPTTPTHWQSSFGNDYLAGNQANDLLFGELGNDTIQGDGSIDFVAHREIDNGNGTGSLDPAFPGWYDSNNPLGRVTEYREPPTCTGSLATHDYVCQGTGDEILYPSTDRPTDGEDYIEGNGGNDLILGGLGQDDLVGGNSSMFSLAGSPLTIVGVPGTWTVVRVVGNTLWLRGAPLPFGSTTYTVVIAGVGTFANVTLGSDQVGPTLTSGTGWAGVTDGANLRPDGNDVIFGGSGLHTVRDDDTNIGTLAQQHARDADTICGDNCDIVRIVGFNGLDVATGKDLNLPATPRYVSFVYDNYDCAPGQAVCAEPNGYDPNGRIVVRGTTLLDYTPGGPDFRPDLFGANTGNCANGSPASGPCSNPIPLCSGSGAGTSRYVDIGGRDEIHGETGNDTAYGACGNDVVYGDAQDDELYGNWGDDWISGGTGVDGVLGDDGRLLTSRNSIVGYTWDNANATW
ncbi:MAG TPA: hypothetical protein VFJ93_03815, partial [Gaiellaceae bacterium]|nr:hypothetical protein [Gaiellaceae bacterium]